MASLFALTIQQGNILLIYFLNWKKKITRFKFFTVHRRFLLKKESRFFRLTSFRTRLFWQQCYKWFPICRDQSYSVFRNLKTVYNKECITNTSVRHLASVKTRQLHCTIILLDHIAYKLANQLVDTLVTCHLVNRQLPLSGHLGHLINRYLPHSGHFGLYRFVTRHKSAKTYI